MLPSNIDDISFHHPSAAGLLQLRIFDPFRVDLYTVLPPDYPYTPRGLFASFKSRAEVNPPAGFLEIGPEAFKVLLLDLVFLEEHNVGLAPDDRI